MRPRPRPPPTAFLGGFWPSRLLNTVSINRPSSDARTTHIASRLAAEAPPSSHIPRSLLVSKPLSIAITERDCRRSAPRAGERARVETIGRASLIELAQPKRRAASDPIGRSRYFAGK